MEKLFEKQWLIKIQIYSKDLIRCMAFLSNLDDPQLIAFELRESYEGKKANKYISSWTIISKNQACNWLKADRWETYYSFEEILLPKKYKERIMKLA